MPVLVVALAATTLAGLLVWVAPAWYASHVDPAGSLKDGGRSGSGMGSQRLRRWLNRVGEFGLAFVVAGWCRPCYSQFLESYARGSLGYARIMCLPSGWQPQGRRFQDSGRDERVRPTRNAQCAAICSGSGACVGRRDCHCVEPSDGMPFTLVGGRTYSDPSQRPGTGFQSVSPDYFRTFGIQVLSGRSFTDQDTATSVRVAMVNQEFANRYLKGMDPFKQRVCVKRLFPASRDWGLRLSGRLWVSFTMYGLELPRR